MLDPGGARHFTVAIQTEPSSKDGISRFSTARKNCRNAGPNRALSNDKLPFTLDDRRMSNLDTSDICDCIVRARFTSEVNAERPSIGNLLSLRRPIKEH